MLPRVSSRWSMPRFSRFGLRRLPVTHWLCSRITEWFLYMCGRHVLTPKPDLVALVDTRWSSQGPPAVVVALVDARHPS
jgi:hypothetical protein